MGTETLTNFTYNDLLEMPNDGRHYEILDGELIVNAAPIPRHQVITFNLASILRSYVRPRGIGTVYIAPIDVVFTQEWVVEPDVIYIRKERKAIVTRTNVTGAPDLAVEVLSASTRKRDEITKRRAYEDFGVGEYWVVDPELESVKIYRRDEAGRYERVVEVSTETDGAAFTSPLFPGLEIALAEVFEEQ
jgi:Uma2 family endonuclease